MLNTISSFNVLYFVYFLHLLLLEHGDIEREILVHRVIKLKISHAVTGMSIAEADLGLLQHPRWSAL